MKILRSTVKKIDKNKSSKSVPHLEITVVVLVHFYIVSNDFQRDSRALYTFTPNK